MGVEEGLRAGLPPPPAARGRAHSARVRLPTAPWNQEAGILEWMCTTGPARPRPEESDLSLP